MANEGRFAERLEFVLRLASRHAGTVTDLLNETRWSGRVPLAALPVYELITLAQEGLEASLVVRSGAWSANLSSSGAGGLTIAPVTGPWEDAFEDPAAAGAARDSSDRNDIAAFLGYLTHLDAEVTVRATHSAPDAQWVRTGAAFLELFAGTGWLGMTRELLEDGKRTVVVEDAAEHDVLCGGIHIRGPDASPQHIGDDFPGAEYRRTWLDLERREMPTPVEFEVVDERGLEDIASCMRTVAGKLAWAWVAQGLRVEEGDVRATYEGVRALDVKLQEPFPQLDILLELWRWATASADAARREATHQAITLAVRDDDDLVSAPAAVLRTARYLHRLSQQRLVSEALSARRAAREGTVNAARSAADAARAIARKTFDRVGVQIAAVVAIFIASREAVLRPATGVVVLGAILLLLVLTATSALLFEYPGARRELDASLADLDVYRETLPQADIDEIRDARSSTDAYRQIGLARRWTLGTVVAAMLLAAAVLGLIVTREAGSRLSQGMRLLDQLDTAEEYAGAGYGREFFGSTPCSTRREVLIAESRVAARRGKGCRVISGEWISAYDGFITKDPGQLEIDHLVPLREAWHSSAVKWSRQRRARFANDLEHPETLLAVSASSNASKRDRDPASWMPPRVEYWCQYALSWMRVKIEWKLTADQDERVALRAMVATCDE